MPGLRDTFGRVTVRLFLSPNGNLEDVQLVQSGGNANLDQSVVFAVKQASFPIPPSRSTASDRTFLVTYIYQ
jgi:TonB family protein